MPSKEAPINAELLKKFIKEQLPNVSGLKRQLNDSEINRLAVYSKVEIEQTLLEMENHAQLQKKYVSVFLTLRNWIELKRKKTQVAASNQIKKMGYTGRFTHTEAHTYMEKKGIPFSEFLDRFDKINDANGKIYWSLKNMGE